MSQPLLWIGKRQHLFGEFYKKHFIKTRSFVLLMTVNRYLILILLLEFAITALFLK